jgi:integrase
MTQRINRLSDRRVQTVKTPGRHSDGGGLYLVVDKSGAKRWVFMSWKGGRQIEIGLGGLSSRSLSAARGRAADCRRFIAEGRDPRDAVRNQNDAASFGQFADQVIGSLESGWRNDKHRQQWRNTLTTYAAPIRDKALDAISTEDILGILQPIWTTKAETASRVRGRIEKILDAGKAKGLRDGENPARWRGHLDNLLPRRQKLQRGHHAAMPWSELPGFIERLRSRSAVSALACEFLILTAARSGEILRSKRDGVIHYMRWDEVDFQTRVWTVPAVRMKAGLEHRVPLSDRAMEILRELRKLDSPEFVFPSTQPGKPLSEGGIVALLRRMEITHATPHGFRSSFRDWAGECTPFPRDIAEMALAHAVGDQTERAYRRGDALERRRKLMDAWGQFLEGTALE